LIGSVLRKKSTDVRADNTPKISKQDDLEFPDFLRVENRTPLTSEQRARLDAAGTSSPTAGTTLAPAPIAKAPCASPTPTSPHFQAERIIP
jgi:hypothetical protein